jgi:gliding motility-associated-like protein
MLPKIIGLLFFFNLFFVANAQDFSINQEGTYTSCLVNFFDSDSLGMYQNNEDYTITFCSDGSGGGNTVNVGFGGLFKIDPSDTLYVYDGSSTASPLIGAYNNNNIPIGVTTTTSNPSGCITFRFVSDASVVDSGWVAILNCVKVCQPIEPIVTTIPALTSYGPDSNYTNICAGDTVFFTASGVYPDNGVNGINYPQSDATSTYEWNFGEGTESTTQTGSIVYGNEGGYAVLLTITDANGCQEQIIHKVRTGITPNFPGIYAMPDSVCFGDTIQLMGGFNQTLGAGSGFSPNSGAITAGGTVTGQTFLPDGNGNSYTTSVGISGFPGQTITAGTDIETVCMNIEHSYLGDLDFQLTCPNGTTIMLSDNYGGAGSGNVFLGDANDDGSNDPGIGMDYCFTLGAVWGTMVDENIAGNYIPSTFDPGNNVLAPGDFQPEESFNGLIGCPIDGDWTITVTDNIGIDNGYIFEWGITLNPNINPNAEYYDVAIADGAWQASPDIIAPYDSLTIAYTQVEGSNQYTFQVTDEYGCTFDTIVNVYVLQELNAIATPDTNLCLGQQVELNVGGFVPNCEYVVWLHDSWGDGWSSPAQVDILINGVVYLAGQTVSSCSGSECEVFLTIPVTTGDVITLNYTTGSWNSENSMAIYDADGNEVFLVNNPNAGLQTPVTAECSGGVSFSWGPTNDLSDPTLPNPIFSGSNTTTYAVEMFLTNHPECSVVSDSITITVNNLDLPTISGDSAVCFGSPVTYTISGADTIIWPDNSFAPTYTYTPLDDDVLTVTASTFCGNITWSKHVVVYPEINLLASPDTIICDGDAVTLNLAGVLDECTYLLTLIDSAGNGWGSFEGVDIKINGVLYESGVSVLNCGGTYCTTSMVIPINDGDVLTLEYTSGATDIENTIQLFDASNAEVLNITNPTAGVLGTFNTSCNNAYDITWSPSTQLSDATVINPVFSGSTSETLGATVSLNANPNCSGISNTIYLDVRPIDVPDIIGDSVICIGTTVSLNINADSVLWWGDTTNVSTTFTFTPQQDSLVTATATTFCVKNAVTTHYVVVNPLPVITSINDTTITIQDVITLTTTGGEIYTWIPSTYLSCSDCPSPEAAPEETTLYEVIVTDSNGCVSSRTINVEVLIPDLFIPNGFSPNGDGVNDLVEVRSLSIETMNIKIFDRWGGLIFESNDQAISWDGTFNGTNLDAGVYVYKFESKMVDGAKIEKSGTITLFR